MACIVPQGRPLKVFKRCGAPLRSGERVRLVEEGALRVGRRRAQQWGQPDQGGDCVVSLEDWEKVRPKRTCQSRVGAERGSGTAWGHVYCGGGGQGQGMGPKIDYQGDGLEQKI